MRKQAGLGAVVVAVASSALLIAAPVSAKPAGTGQERGTFSTSLSAVPTFVQESAGSVTVTVSRSASKGEASVTLSPSTVAGEAAAPDDFDASPIVVAFPNKVTSVNVAIPIADDAIAEPSESFRADLTAPSKGYGLAVGGAGGEIVILDEDAATPNTRPTADSKTASATAGFVAVTLTAHDADGDALTFDAGTATKGLVTVPQNVSCDGQTPSTCTATSTYAANPGFTGTDSFEYWATDGDLVSVHATVTVTVN